MTNGRTTLLVSILLLMSYGAYSYGYNNGKTAGEIIGALKAYKYNSQ